MSKVIARIKGGLGNQLFCYAAARRLALVNNAELVLDDVTGFVRDRPYRRRFMLDGFYIHGRRASAWERLEPLERLRRGLLKWRSRRLPFEKRPYIEQEGVEFDERLLHYKVRGTIWLDGLWQGEGYFKDIEATIRDDLRQQEPRDDYYQSTAREIAGSVAVAVHVRWFDDPQAGEGGYNLPVDYYQRAITMMEERLNAPRYFVFSDDVHAARQRLQLPEGRSCWIFHPKGENDPLSDFWLMRQCRYFIIANSTFSWWGAWLADWPNKTVIAPGIQLQGKAAWGFQGLIPNDWVML